MLGDRAVESEHQNESTRHKVDWLRRTARSSSAQQHARGIPRSTPRAAAAGRDGMPHWCTPPAYPAAAHTLLSNLACFIRSPMMIQLSRGLRRCSGGPRAGQPTTTPVPASRSSGILPARGRPDPPPGVTNEPPSPGLARSYRMIGCRPENAGYAHLPARLPDTRLAGSCTERWLSRRGCTARAGSSCSTRGRGPSRGGAGSRS